MNEEKKTNKTKKTDSEEKSQKTKKEKSFLSKTKFDLVVPETGRADAYEEFDVENIKEVATMIAELFVGIKKSKEDGKWNAMDGIYFVPFLKAAYAAIEDADMIDDEFRDLSKKEVDEIRLHVYGKVEETFPKFTDEVKEWINDCIRTALMLVYCISEGFKIL